MKSANNHHVALLLSISILVIVRKTTTATCAKTLLEKCRTAHLSNGMNSLQGWVALGRLYSFCMQVNLYDSKSNQKNPNTLYVGTVKMSFLQMNIAFEKYYF